MSAARREDEEEAAALAARAENNWECVTVRMLIQYAPRGSGLADNEEINRVLRGLAILAYMNAAKDGKEPATGG